MRRPAARGPSALPASFLAEEFGSVTVEFVLWVPVLAAWFVFSALFFDAYMSRNRAANAAYTLADIVSRQTQVDDAFITELYDLQEVLQPEAPAGARLRVSSIRYDQANDRYLVLWSRARGGVTALPEGQPVTSDLFPQMADQDTIILMELEVPYRPFSDWAGIGDRFWTFRLVTRPRFVSSIPMI